MLKTLCLHPHSLTESRTISAVGINKTLLLEEVLDEADKFVTNFTVYFMNFLKKTFSEQHTAQIILSRKHILFRLNSPFF